jgi:hypothetical protein
MAEISYLDCTTQNGCASITFNDESEDDKETRRPFQGLG